MPLNLVQDRAGPSVWERPRSREPWDVERWMAAMAAGALFVTSIRRRTIAGWFLAAGGGALAWWAASAIDTRNFRRERLWTVLSRQDSGDQIGEASEESFPASDAPAWTATGNTAGAGSCDDVARRRL